MPSSCCRLCSTVDVQLSWLPSLRLSAGAFTLRAVSRRLSAHACSEQQALSCQFCSAASIFKLHADAIDTTNFRNTMQRRPTCGGIIFYTYMP